MKTWSIRHLGGSLSISGSRHSCKRRAGLIGGFSNCGSPKPQWWRGGWVGGSPGFALAHPPQGPRLCFILRSLLRFSLEKCFQLPRSLTISRLDDLSVLKSHISLWTKARGRRNRPEDGLERNRRTIQNGHFSPHFNLRTDPLGCGRSSQLPSQDQCTAWINSEWPPRRILVAFPSDSYIKFAGGHPSLHKTRKPREITKVPLLIGWSCLAVCKCFNNRVCLTFFWPPFKLGI